MTGFEDYIRLLTHESLTGIISPENKVVLEKAIAENPQAHAVWVDAAAHFESLQPTLKEMRLPDDISMGIFESIEKKRIRRRRIITATSIAALLITALFLYQPKKIIDKKGIVLEIAGGETIPLTEKQNYTTGAVTLKNNAGTLSYQTTSPSPKLNKLSVPTGMTYQLVLDDGSKIWLNAATTLEFPFTFNGDTREINIDGEAYIEIAKDDNKPFFVHIKNTTVQVLGTTFNVNTYDKPRVALVSGAVKITTGGKSLQLKPGFEADDQLQTREFDADNLLAWRYGQYYFTKATLQEVSEVISRWYGTKVIIDNPTTANRPFTGNLNRNHPLEEFLKGVHQLMDVEYYYQDDILHLK